MRASVAILASLAAAAIPSPLVAQRAQATIGTYTPPRSWPARQRTFDLLHQTIAVGFDMAHRGLNGTVTTRVVVLRNPTDTIRLDASHLTIDGVRDRNDKPLRFTYDTTHVTVRLPKRAAAGDTVEFTIRYHGTPERGVYFVPRRQIIWTQSEANETSSWIPTYDAPNDKTTWEFFVTADSGMKVLSNGRLMGTTPVDGGAHVVWHWSQDLPAATYLYSVVVGPFTVLRDEWRGIPVEYWVYPDTVNAAWRTFGETPSMIELYSRLVGVPFPWAKYDQSAIPDFTYGGMENVTATTQSDLALHGEADEPEQTGRSLVAHELAHQWFGDLTTTADWADIWLNEGMATYMESVQLEKTRGLAAAQLEWYDQQQQAMQADLVQERPLVWGEYEGSDPIALFFSGHVYPKGAQVAHQLRRLLGDSLFWAGLHRFLTDNAYKSVTTADYAVAFERTCRCDLDWFFDQWAYGIGYPKVRFARRYNSAAKTLEISVAQTQRIDSLHPVFRFPVTLRVSTRDSVIRRNVMVSKVNESFTLPLPGPPVSFRFDEGGWLLGEVTGDLTPAELADQAEHDVDVAGRHWALVALASLTDSVATAARRLIALNEHEVELRRMAVEQLARDSGPDIVAVVQSALRDPASEVRAEALGTLDSLDRAGAKGAAEAAFGGDPSNYVRAHALRVLLREAPDEAFPLVLEATKPGNSLVLRFTAARLLAGVRDPRAADALTSLTDPREPRDLRVLALRALGHIDNQRAASACVRALADPDPLFAVAAVRELAEIGGADGRDRLAAAGKTETRVTVRSAINEILQGR